MIQMPRRSVTRFFIPMIDVLTLLFCIFLLMPFVKSAGEGEGETGATPVTPEVSPGDAKELAKKIEQLQKEIDRLRQERAELVKHLLVRPLEIDKDNGGLFWYAGTGREAVRTQDDATRLIDQQRREARARGGQEPYFLILYPRGPSSFPTEGQVREYQRWFQGVAHGFDNPRAQE